MSNENIRIKKRKKFFGARFTTTLSIALVLFVIGLMAVGALTMARLSDVLREQFTITIEMSDAAAKGYGAKLANTLNSEPYTKQATYISADSALTVLTKQLGENPENFLGYNPLHASVELQLMSAYAVNDSIEPIVKSIEKLCGKNIEAIDYNKSLIDIVNHNHWSAFAHLHLAYRQCCQNGNFRRPFPHQYNAARGSNQLVHTPTADMAERGVRTGCVFHCPACHSWRAVGYNDSRCSWGCHRTPVQPLVDWHTGGMRGDTRNPDSSYCYMDRSWTLSAHQCR